MNHNKDIMKGPWGGGGWRRNNKILHNCTFNFLRIHGKKTISISNIYRNILSIYLKSYRSIIYITIKRFFVKKNGQNKDFKYFGPQI